MFSSNAAKQRRCDMLLKGNPLVGGEASFYWRLRCFAMVITKNTGGRMESYFGEVKENMTPVHRHKSLPLAASKIEYSIPVPFTNSENRKHMPQKPVKYRK